jgi:hypothetical protein
MKALKPFAQSQGFHRLVSIMIVLCSVTLGIETLYPEHKVVFDIIDMSFTFFFIYEIIIRLLAEDYGLNFFKLFSLHKQDGQWKFTLAEDGFWNWFDFTIVTVSVISLFSHVFEHPEFLVVKSACSY